MLNKCYVYWLRRDKLAVVARVGSPGFLTTLLSLQFLLGTKLLDYYGNPPCLPRACAEFLCHSDKLYTSLTSKFTTRKTAQHIGFTHLEFYGVGGGLVAKSCPTLRILWTVVCQAPLSMGFSRQEYWSGLPFLSPGDLPNPGVKPGSPALQADSLATELQEKLRGSISLAKLRALWSYVVSANIFYIMIDAVLNAKIIIN